MALCYKKVKDVNPCSPTFGREFTKLVSCPPIQKFKIPCSIPVFSVGVDQTTSYKDCKVQINSILISIA